MAPGVKRKRGDGRSYSQDDDHSNRPSPHRPQNLALANSPRGGRRGSRTGGRGGFGGPHSPSVTTHTSPTAMSPSTNAYQPSRPTQPPQSAPAPQKAQVPVPPDAPEVPESNDHLTRERVASWNSEARDAVVQAAIAAQRDGDIFHLAIVFHEIIQACFKKCMDPAELGSMVRDVVTAPSHESVDSATTFLDTLSSFTEDESVYPQLRQMLLASEIDVAKMRRELESTILKDLELVRPSFPKVAVRKATNALYRQTNYNLLREESEGFSKLITEYFTTVNNEPPSREVISDLYQRVNAFIGAFDLDVGRVLDVTLDVFANLLVKHGKFFVKYLRVSAWWPDLQGTDGVEWEEPEIQTLPNWALPDSPHWYYTDTEREEQLQLREHRDKKFWQRVAELDEKSSIKAFFELGARRITRDLRVTDKSEEQDASKRSQKTAAQQWAEDWIAGTGTLPPPGNDIAAQLLGFKLRFYASEARDASDVLPDNLVYLAALLIKIGFISLADLWPHLYPADSDMPAHREKLQNEKKEREAKRRGKTTNALAMAGALPDDTLPAPAVTRLREAESKPPSKPESERTTPTKSDEEVKDKLPDPIDQKVALLRSLLCIGAIPESLFIIGRYPWLLDVYPDLHTYILRLAHHSLYKVYESARPVPLQKIPSVSKAGHPALSRPGDYIPRRTLRWAKPDQKDAGDGVDYRFYWEDWTDNVPVCQTVDDVFLLCSSFLGLVGPECGRDILLMTKLARIGKRSVVEDPSEGNLQRWADLSTTFLAPALTFTGQNPGVINEMWELFKRFDTATRYRIYQHWFNLTRPAALRAAFKDVQDDTRNLLGKVASTNTRPMGRAMAKLAYSCPGIVFQQTLKQGQGYINMIDALVECSRYLTHLGYDCLTWTLVNTLVTNDKPTLQGDGMLVKGWLKNTAIFIGKVYRRYSLMDPTPVLQFVKHQVFRPEGELYMLTVLEQLIASMGGIGLSGALTEGRVLALSAGPCLRAYTLEHHLGDHRHQAKPPARRLNKCLKDTGLTPQILIAIAQQVKNYLFREELENVPDKVVFTNFDNLRSSFAQFLEFLRENLSESEFDGLIPGVVSLMSDYSLDASLAFQIHRDSIAAQVNSTRLKNGSGKMADSPDEDVTMAGVDSHIPNGVPAVDGAGDIEMKDEVVADNSGTLQPPTDKTLTPNGMFQTTTVPSRSNSAIEAIAEQLQTALPEKYKDHLFLNFFVTFWSLSLKDVYSADGAELRQQYEDAKKFAFSKVSTSDRRGMGHETPSYRQAKEEAKKLTEEYDALLTTSRITQSGLHDEMQSWFDGITMGKPHSTVLHNKLLQDCFLIRARMSLQDAQFSSAMLFFMHRTGTPGFRTAKLLDQLFSANLLSGIIKMMSEEEAKCFGRFLNDILRELQRWHEDKNVYHQLAHGEKKTLPGFGRSFNPDRTPSELLSFEDFRNLHCKWHGALFTAVKNCLTGGQYTELRNAISILKAVSPAFPKIDTMAKDLRQIIEQHAEDDDRDDIKVAANSLRYEFKRSSKLWKTEVAFRQGSDAAAAIAAATARAASEQPKTPQPQDTTAKKLNATAPSFKPNVQDTNGLSKPGSERSSFDDKKPPAPSSAAFPPRTSDRDSKTASTPKPTAGPITSSAMAPPQARDAPKAAGAVVHSSPAASMSNRLDNRLTTHPAPPSRLQHALPTRPDSQPPRGRHSDRPNDRPLEFSGHGRHDTRPTSSHEHMRSERPIDPLRDREASPGRRMRPRSPDRGMNSADRREWGARDPREYDERSLRAPPRDIRDTATRGPAWGDTIRDPRDARDGRDARDTRDYREREPLRERVDPRTLAHPSLQSTNDPRSRLHSNQIMTANDMPPHRREMPSASHHGDRGSLMPPRPPQNTGPPSSERPLLNPDRAAYINGDRGRNEPSSRSDRESRRDDRRDDREPRRDDREARRDDRSRRDRGSRPQSPRRSDDRAGVLPQGREPGRDHRDDRGAMQSHPANRERRDELTSNPPTGPRSGRDVPPPGRVSREMFQPSQPSRPPMHQTQDPNYGRLNPPSDTVPSGPRRESQGHTPSTPATPQGTGIHPSRLTNFRGPPPLQTDIPGAPSGPRGSTRNPPTGPASADRNPRNQDNRNTLRAINSVLTGNAPSPTAEKRPGREHSRSPDRSREKRDSSRRDRDREREHRERERRDGRDDRRRDDRERERKRPRDPQDQGSHGDSKRRR